jgi:hypothetical protein
MSGFNASASGSQSLGDDHDLARARHLDGLSAALRGLQERLAEVERRWEAREITVWDRDREIEEITKLADILDGCW